MSKKIETDRYIPVTPPGGALSSEQIRMVLPSELQGLHIGVYDRVRSTNDTAATLLAAEQDEPFVVALAEQQEGGRGRRGRTWVSPPKMGLLMTVALTYPSGTITSPGEWPLLAALAARSALADETGLPIKIKWPNDLLVHGKKVCGILTEWLTVRPGAISLAIGVGVNVNTDPSLFPNELLERATSLFAEGGTRYNRNQLAGRLIKNLFYVYESTLRGGTFQDVHSEMLTHCSSIGQYVRLLQGQDWLEGIVETIDSTGALRLRSLDGVVHSIRSGEIIQSSPLSVDQADL